MKALLWVAGTLTTVAGLVAILWSETVQGWADDHPRVLFVGVLALAATCIVLAELWWRERRRVVVATPGQGHEASNRDRDLFARFLAEFPPSEGSAIYLQTAFFGKQWYWSRLKQVEKFANGWEMGVFFDDPKVEQAREKLLRACQEFMSDAAAESDTPGENDDVARLVESHLRHGGQDEWEATRKRLNDEAAAVVAAHDGLHRLGRERGL